MLSHMVERLRLAKKPDNIILITSTVTQDDELEAYAKEEGIDCFRGDPDDVLVRMRDAANVFDVDTVISCTADNPFVDPIYIDKLIDFHTLHKNDFSKCDGLPFGTFSYAINRAAIQQACDIKDEVDTEVWGGYFTDNKQFQCGTFIVDDPDVCWPNLRLTVDTEEDFSLVTNIFSRLSNNSKKIFGLKEIVKLCRDYPELIAINSHIEQKKGNPIKIKKSL